MNQEKVGKFISELRKKKGMTQEELGSKLGVTDKTISRWETGKYMPDISLFKPLSEILGVSINDLMSGEIVDKKDYQDTFEKNVMGAIENVDRANKISDIIANVLLGIILLFIISFSSYIFYMNYPFKIKYDPNIMKIEVCEEGKICKHDIMFYLNVGHSKFRYLLMSAKEEDKEIGLVFITTWHTLEDISNDKKNLINENCIDLSNRPSYGGDEIKINNETFPKKIRIYYTNESLSKIADADKRKLNKIIEKSNLMYENIR